MASFQEIYNQITQAINEKNSSKRPTFPWIAGTFKRAHDFNRFKNYLDNYGDELDPETAETYTNILKLLQIALDNNLISSENGVYKTTPRGSKFLQELSRHIKQWDNINDLSYKDIRREVQAAKGEADQEWYNSLPPLDQAMIDLYSKLTPKEFHFLTGLKNSKDSKSKYVNRVETLEDSDPESYAVLKSLRFINANNQINDKLLTTFFSTLGKYDYRHLRSFNRSISSKSDRIAADKALAMNEYIRKQQGKDVAGKDYHRYSGVNDTDTRQMQRSRVLSGRKDDFNQRLRRTKASMAEHKDLSFKNYLIEEKSKHIDKRI